MDPKVSIIMTSYNYEQYISEAINSVLGQTFKDWELLIVDDGSKDSSVEIIQKYVSKHPEKIKYLEHPAHQNKGLMASLELGIYSAKGKYIAFLEADDTWEKDNLFHKQVALDGNEDAVLAYSDIKLTGDRELIFPKFTDYMNYVEFIGKMRLTQPYDAIKYTLHYNQAATFSNMMISKHHLKSVEFSQKYESWLDWWILIQLSLKGKFYFIGKKLINWRIHGESKNFQNESQGDQAAKKEEFKQDIFKLIRKNYGSSLDSKQMEFIQKHLFGKKEAILHGLGFAMFAPSSALRKLFSK